MLREKDVGGNIEKENLVVGGEMVAKEVSVVNIDVEGENPLCGCTQQRENSLIISPQRMSVL